MARKVEGRTFNVSVIGLSGTEKDKGQYGIGKSCICNRFLNPEADGYYHEHISVLSQSDFAGRVINNDHFLYWGNVTKVDDGNNFTFQVVEQTEFIDDVSFSPFKSARTETYIKRAVSSKVQSAEKLMYICKDQLGMETDSAYPQVVMPEGKLMMDGFLCCFDVSKVPQRSIEKQVDFVAGLLNNALKAKKPVVLATTKGESSCAEYVKEVEKLINRKEFKGNVPLVETSAHENINVEAAFLLLAHLIDKTKGRAKILPFYESRKQRYEILEVAKEAFINLLRTTVSDSKATWNGCKKKLEPESDFIHYVEMFGTDQAKKEFRAHTKRLRDEHIRKKELKCLQMLPVLLKHFIPSLDHLPERGWNSVRRLVREHPEFDTYFLVVEEEGCSSWKQVDSFLDDKDECRIPFDLLNSTEAEMCFRNHLNELQAQHRKMELQRQFKLLLEENTQVTPGKPLSETYVFFVGKECYSNLEESDRLKVYDQHMSELRAGARMDFSELLWEKSHVFWGLDTSTAFTERDLQSINTALEDDSRYKALHRLEEHRKVLILNHLGFMQAPSRERCGFAAHCIDTQVENLLASRAIRPDLKSSSDSVDSCAKTLNMVLLGKDGLAITLNKEIRILCTDDEYRIEGSTYSLDYRPIDGDVSREQNALATANFKPHGCLCVYNSEETLNYVKESLECSLTNDVVKEGGESLQGMPIAIIQTINSSHSPEDVAHLTERGKAIAARLHGEFILGSGSLESGMFFTDTQIHTALQMVIHACSPGLNGWYLSDQFEPDIRVSMCLMCGDPFPLDLPLGPLLNHDMCRVLADTPYCITLDLFLESGKQKVEVEVASYHGGNRLHEGIFHGHILVYSARRKASLTTMRAFADGLLRVPKLVVAVTDSGSGTSTLSFLSNDVNHALVQEGQQLAESMDASFMTTTANFTQQTAIFQPFFKAVWDRREESEMLYTDPSYDPCPSVYDKAYYGSRPPAPLPKPYAYHTHKSSTSNSTDSEPVYDMPKCFYSHYSDSDHEGDRGSSASPPPHNTGEELYSEAIIPNGDCLVKPSVVKARKNLYAGRPFKPSLASNSSKLEHRKSLPIMSSLALSMEAHTPPSSTSSITTSNSNGGSNNNSSSSLLHFGSGSHAVHDFSLSQSLVRDPQEFFRKSCSMKVAAEEAVEAGDEAEEEEDEEKERKRKLEEMRKKETRAWALNEHRRKQGETFPSGLKGASSSEDGWPDVNNSASMAGHADPYGQGQGRYTSSQSSHDIPWSDKGMYMSSSNRRRIMNTRSQSQSAAMSRSHHSQVYAPLAKPEAIEIADYCNVKDAVPQSLPLESDYQVVQDALPPGQLHRIRSTKSPIRMKGRTDSEDSEFSSLERERHKMSKRPTPHRRKSKPRSQDKEPLYSSPIPSSGRPKHFAISGKENIGFAVKAVRSHSPSEDGSEGTGDETRLVPHKERKRRSFNQRRWREPGAPPAQRFDQRSMTSSPNVNLFEDGFYNHGSSIYRTMPKEIGATNTRAGGEEGDFDLNDSGNWSSRLKAFKTMKETEKQKKKKDERRRQKEEEKRAKEAQKKTKKKDNKTSLHSSSGIALEDCETALENPSIPLFVFKCVQYIESEGMQTEGLYRISGNKAQGELFLSKFAADHNVDIASLEIPVNAIATLLKSFLSDLNKALIPSSICDELMELAEMGDKSGRLLMLRGVIKKLPDQNYELLKFIISHLYRVAENQSFNSMNSRNLAKCWWPTLIRLEFKSYEKMVQGTQVPEDIINALIEQSNFIFYGGDEV